MKITDIDQVYKTGAGCLLLSRDTENFLLIQRSEYVPAPNVWGLPGGKLDKNEEPEFAAKRELYEETGINLLSRQFSLIYKNEVHAPRFTFYTYACIVENEMTPKLNWESSDFVWCNMSSLPTPLHWGVSQLLHNNIAGNLLKRMLDQKASVDN